MTAETTTIVVFLLTLFLTFAAAIYARIQAKPGSSEEDLAGRNLNKWLIGLSAGTTGNSGFIVTGAVGLGYAGGAQWLLLPLGWLFGDLVYWAVFPDKINRYARSAGATTISELVTHDLPKKIGITISILISVILVTFLSIYTSAQWLAGEKFLGVVFSMSETTALLGFGLVIVFYSAIGGFRGSVYVDTLQAIIRIGGTILALVVVLQAAQHDTTKFWSNIHAAGPTFLDPLARGSFFATVAFVLGFAGAAVGFGLGQPQIVTRYMAGETPKETKAAWWIYIAFLQGTWIAMTLFGIILRGVQPNIADPETGLSLFFQTNVGAVATGIIFADVFATIAGTSNGLLVAMSQTIRRDLLGRWLGESKFSLGVMTAFTLGLGLATVGLSFVLPGNVYSIAIAAVSQIGAGLAGAVMIKVLGWRHTGASLLAAIVAGSLSGVAWWAAGLSDIFNEALIGIVASLIANAIARRATNRQLGPGAAPS